MGTPELVYCADGQPEFAGIAVSLGWRYGARLPATVYQPVWFADQDWKRPDLVKYAAAVREHRPEVATVLDWEHPEQLSDVLAWAEEVAPHVGRVVVIPKVPGRVCDVPESIGGKPVVLGYSVPTSYGGTPCGVWEFAGRPVHLLGGSPQAQLRLRRYLNVVSADGNMTAMQARKGRFWSRRPGPKGHWTQLRETGDERTNPAAECFRRSLVAVREAWATDQVTTPLPPPRERGAHRGRASEMGETLTTGELDRLAELERAATAGKWHVKPVRDDEGEPYPTMYQTWVFVEPTVCGLWAEEGKNLNDAAFIAAARNSFRALLALARKGLAAESQTPAAPAAPEGR